MMFTFKMADMLGFAKVKKTKSVLKLSKTQSHRDSEKEGENLGMCVEEDEDIELREREET